MHTMRRPAIRTLVVVALAGTLITAGCGGPAGDWHSVSHWDGPLQVEDGVFIMQGKISIGQGAQPDETYHGVRVVLYDEQKEVIMSKSVGTLATNPNDGPQSQPVNITSEEVPEYILIESPEFWTNGTDMEVESFVYKAVDEAGGPDARYETYHRTGPDEKFPDET